MSRRSFLTQKDMDFSDKVKNPKICFCAIFRNESKNVYRCLNAAKPIIDFVYISDTGSTDNTVELIKKWGKENDKKTVVEFETFKNFGYNRTLAFEMMVKSFPKADYALLLDADMVLKFGEAWKSKKLFQKDIYYFKQKNSSIIYDNIRLISTKKKYKCIGVTHEYWDTLDSDIILTGENIIYIKDVGDGGHKQNKQKRDRKLLEDEIYKSINPVSNFLRGRYYFYLARTLKDMGKYEKAIEYFNERVLFPCPPQERYHSYMEIGDCYVAQGKVDRGIYYYSKAWEKRPIRAESIHKIAHYYTFSKQYHLAVLWGEKGRSIPRPTFETLFVFNAFQV